MALGFWIFVCFFCFLEELAHGRFDKEIRSEATASAGSGRMKRVRRSCGCHSHNGFLLSERASELYVDEVLDGKGHVLYLDKVGSVSAFDLDLDYDEKHTELNADS